MTSNSQAGQDLFVLSCLNYKRNGVFLEIGSNDPITINNSYLLEKTYGWKGLMIEYERRFLPAYKLHRPNSTHIISDATQIDYRSLCASLPNEVDYLQIDLEVENQSTIATLRKVSHELMDTRTFATVTFEHDIYRGDFFSTRKESREIFDQKGYVRVFSDVKFKNSAFEDWYVHPSLVDMTYINSIKTDASLESSEIVSRLRRA
jgi:hypothetical protein